MFFENVTLLFFPFVGQSPANGSCENEPYRVRFDPPIMAWVEHTRLKNGALGEINLEIQVSPDHQRGIALIAQNEIDLLVTGVNVGAKAYNKGIDLKLVNTNVWGIDYLLADFPAECWSDLEGKTLSVPLLGGREDRRFPCNRSANRR
jgi:hypothetical protein